jgi:DNA (cytosine-5)-methyltransferase 3A
MIVFSAFDGMGCGRVALERDDIPVTKYYSSEINRHSMDVVCKNYPDTIHVGDITKVDLGSISTVDLLMGGSPCQGFSVAGKGLNFDDPRSKLFFDFIRLKEELKPRWFLLENVKMKKEWVDIITKHMGVEPIEINSELVSAQHRRRLYWTNIPGVTQPEDKGVMLSDILEKGVGGIPVNLVDGKWEHVAKNKKRIVIDRDDFPFTIYESRTDEGKRMRRELRKELGRDTTPRSAEHKIYVPRKHDKSNCIVATPSELDCVVDHQGNYRKLTITELERLQTLPDGYTSGVPESQRRKMIGNGWTVDVITHIFSFIPPRELW